VSGDLDGRRVLVTGASSGIGAASARACAARGARVALLARSTEAITRLAEELGGIAVPADVTDHEAVRRAVDAAADGLGGLDGVVNNAGVLRRGVLADQPVDDWRLMLDVNVLGLLSITQAAIPHLRAATGSRDMVLMSSMSGRRVPGHTSAVYSATKHAVHAISQALRRELHPDGVRVTTISPGFVATDIAGDQADLSAQVAALGFDPAHVGRAVAAALAAPPDVNVVELAVAPTEQEI
jgi:NADP-dependent 3-hydroxy acid dehydrogenase YdfG